MVRKASALAPASDADKRFPGSIRSNASSLTDKKIRRGIYRSVAAPKSGIVSFIRAHNSDPKPFRWTKSADDTLASIERFCRYNAPAAIH